MKPALQTGSIIRAALDSGAMTQRTPVNYVTQTVTASTITLDDLLNSQGIGRIDFLSMDIELHEPKALAGFDVQKFKPALVCVEAHPEVRQQILDYFAARDYVVVAKYLRADAQNLWFMPARTGA